MQDEYYQKKLIQALNQIREASYDFYEFGGENILSDHFVLTDIDTINHTRIIKLTKDPKGEGIFMYQTSLAIYEAIKNEITEQKKSPLVKIFCLSSMNFQTGEFPLNQKLYERLAKKKKILVINFNPILSLASNSKKSLEDLLIGLHIDTSINFEELVDKNQGYDLICGPSNPANLQTISRLDIEKLFQNLKLTNYDFIFIEQAYHLSTFFLSNLSLADHSFLFYSSDFDWDYAKKIHQNLHKSLINPRTSNFVFGKNEPDLSNFSYYPNHQQVEVLDEVIQIVNKS